MSNISFSGPKNSFLMRNKRLDNLTKKSKCKMASNMAATDADLDVWIRWTKLNIVCKLNCLVAQKGVNVVVKPVTVPTLNIEQ